MAQPQSMLSAIAAGTLCVWFVVAVSAAVIMAVDVFLLSVLGIVLAVFLTKTSGQLSQKSGLSYAWSLGIIVLLLTIASGGTLFFFGSQIEQRIVEASDHLDDASESLRSWIKQRPMVETAVSDFPFAKELLSGDPLTMDNRSQKPEASDQQSSGDQQSSQDQDDGNDKEAALSENGQSDSRIGQALKVIARIFQTTLGAVMNLAVVLFVGLFLAADPDLYRDGLTRLFPRDRRDRVREILDQMGSTLWLWLLGRFGSMLITGIGTALGLALIRVPMPITLGILTGLLTFIPNIGPAIGLSMAMLVALPEGGTTATLVVPIFLGFQLLESYIITPLIQQQQVEIAPAVLITWQVLLGMLTGFLGVMVSTPLLAMLFVLVRMAYLEDVLGDSTLESEEPESS